MKRIQTPISLNQVRALIKERHPNLPYKIAKCEDTEDVELIVNNRLIIDFVRTEKTAMSHLYQSPDDWQIYNYKINYIKTLKFLKEKNAK